MDLHVRSTGSGEKGTVVFVHGFPFDGSIWEAQLAALPRGWRGVAPDLRGFGRSPLGAADLPSGRKAGAGVAHADEPVLTMDSLADDLARLIERHAGGPAVVAGLSMGGYAAFALLRRRPELVRALVLVDTRAAPDSDEARENRRRMAATIRTAGTRPVVTAMVGALIGERTRTGRPDVVEALDAMMSAIEPLTLIAALAGMAGRNDSTAFLPEIDFPTLVIVGAEDAIIPPSEAAAMAAAIPGARFETVDGAAHLPCLEEPDVVNWILADFLAGL